MLLSHTEVSLSPFFSLPFSVPERNEKQRPLGRKINKQINKVHKKKFTSEHSHTQKLWDTHL